MTDQVERTAIIALGSNLGDRAALLDAAVDEIGALSGVVLDRVSSFIETPALTPNGVDDTAPPYFNGVVSIRTTLEPQVLLEKLNEIEADHGRVRTERWGDRTLDLDIIAMGELQVSTDSLTLPHPRAFERDFVLRPWFEIEPDAVLVGHGPVARLLGATS